MWPRRQSADSSTSSAKNSTSGVPTLPGTAPSTSALPSLSTPLFASRRSTGKITNTNVKSQKSANSSSDDSAWLLRALDKKKKKKSKVETKSQVLKRPDALKTVKKTQQKTKNARKTGAMGLSMSVQERQQLWRNGAVKKPHDEAAERAKQQERERQETGFDRVFQEVFSKDQKEEKGDDEEELDSILGGGAGSSSLELPVIIPVDEEDKQMKETEAKTTGKRRAPDEEETWGFASTGAALSLDDFDTPAEGSESTSGAFGKAAEFERWKAEDAQSAVSDNFVRLTMRKRFKGSSGRAKKRPAYLRARNENPLDKATGDNSTGVAPVVNANGSQQRKQDKPLLADDGVDFIEECLEALAKAEQAHSRSDKDQKAPSPFKEQAVPLEPPRCHHALVCQSLEVKKKNKNHGRRFFACPLSFDEGRCDFFLWEDDHVPMALQTLFTASSTSSTSESAAQAEAIECVPLDIEAGEEEQREAMLTNLRLVFGHAEFRPGQQWAISRVLRRKDTLLVLPTGAGKSLCYQFPALFLPGITLVISPLISLMNDQYESLPTPLKARAVCLSGSSDAGSKAKHAAFVRDLLADKLSLILLSPEKALGAGMQALLALPRVRARLALVCVDEAHCISEWSHHFRPSYLRLAEVFRHAQCVLCVTATASRRVVHDVLHQLRSRQAEAKTCEDESDMVLQMPWQRRNLALEVRTVRSNDERLRHLVQVLPELSKGSKSSGGGVIVYVHQQRQTEELSALLREQLPSTWRSSGKVLAFHAGMAPEAKEKVRTGFAKGRVRVVVATIAFGMGIDKKNVRAVVHFHMPSSVEGYVQQIGRAGRDGKAARALLYLLDDDAVHFRSLLFCTALHQDQLRRLLALVFQYQVAPTSSKHVVDVKYSSQRAGGGLTLVSLERDWLGRHLDLKAATLETFLTLLALDTQREEDKEGLLVTLRPLSMSRCTLQLLDTQAKKLAPRSCVKLLLAAVRRKELPNARVTQRKDGYLSSWTVDLHLHETAHWYAHAVSSRGNGEESTALLAQSSPQQEGETNAAVVAAATNERRMLQELRAAQQTGQIQRMTLSQPAFQVQLSWRVEVTEEIKAEAVDRWTGILYAKHEHLESRQLGRLAHLYGALNAAALPAPAPSKREDEEEDLEEKAHALETKLVHYFEDDVDGEDKADEDQLLKVLRPLTTSLIESIERDTRSLVLLRLGGDGLREEEDKSNAEDVKWTSYAVAKVFHGLTTPQLPTRQWRDHVCWRRYSDVAFERIVQIAHKVLKEDQEVSRGN